MSERYTCKYEYSKRFGRPFHVWTVVGQYGAIHLHISDTEHRDDIDRFHGGIEIHYRTPPDYMENTAPSQDRCWLIKTPCWHDGSSLQATEHWIPLWECDPHNHDKMFDMLSRRADETFSGKSGTVLEAVHDIPKEANPAPIPDLGDKE